MQHTDDKMDESLIAPCGMNCRLCRAYIRQKNHCPGCRGDDSVKSKYCVECKIKNCEQLKKSESGFCFDCKLFPCVKLKNLDKRYRTRYRMSMIDNLNNISEQGVVQFLKDEDARWQCGACGALLCVHKKQCVHCGTEWEVG